MGRQKDEQNGSISPRECDSLEMRSLLFKTKAPKPPDTKKRVEDDTARSSASLSLPLTRHRLSGTAKQCASVARQRLKTV